MAGEGECNWWLQYLEYLQLVKDNKDMLFDYAIREADCFLPNCMNRQKVVDSSNGDVEGHLLELLDKELDDLKLFF